MSREWEGLLGAAREAEDRDKEEDMHTEGVKPSSSQRGEVMLLPRSRGIEEHLEESGQNGSQDKLCVKLGFRRPQERRNQHWQAV